MDEVKSILFAIILGCVAVVAMFAFYADISNNYDIPIDNDIRPIYNDAVGIIGNETNTSREITTDVIYPAQEALLNRTPKEATAETNAITNAMNSFKTLFKIFPLAQKMMWQIIPILGIPPWLVAVAMLLLLIILTIVGLKMFFRVSA